MDIIHTTKAIGNPRRLKVLSILSKYGPLSTKEILKHIDKEAYVQYLYNDLAVLRKAELITREYSENVRGFVYSISHNILEINFETETIRWKET